ncbi:MAG: choice-of-anchor D domain-containing protein [Candidatus Omnitrophica bacterium]|nr:choice-of-anchor D domain-containing protein [Candidatus Omnitrophota bacterium]
MRTGKFNFLKIVLCLWGLFIFSSSAGNGGISGMVVTLPITIGEEGANPTPVSGMPVVFNEDADITALSQQDGVYNLTLSDSLAGSLYILRLDDNINISDLVAHDDIYITSYTVPTMYGGPVTSHTVMVFTTEQLNNLGIALTQGKGAVLVLTYDIDSEGFITGASAVVKNMDGNNVGTVRYLAIAPQAPYGITLKNSPDGNGFENGGTFGFIAYNINPGVVMVSAAKSGYSFLWRPAFIYANSITSGISQYDGILGVAGSYLIDKVRGYLLNEKGEPVGGANITLCGMNKSATTGSDGSFTLTNVPYPAVVVARARKSGYKDTYAYAFINEDDGDGASLSFSNLQDDDEPPTFIIVSNEFAEKLGLDFTGGGVVGGMIEDIDGNPVKGAEVYVWDEYGDIPSSSPVDYIDCMMEGIDEELDSTSDSGIFIIDDISGPPLSLGISSARPVYLKFEHKDIDGNTYYLSTHYIAPVFNNGITLLNCSMDLYIGRIDLVQGITQDFLVDPGAVGVDLFYVKLDVPEEDENYPTPYLNSLALTWEGDLSPEVALYKKVGEEWIPVSTQISYGGNKIYFNNITDLQLPAEIVVKGSFPQGEDSLSLSAPYFYCELEKNCDVVVTADISEILVSTLVYVSVINAPIKGNKIYIRTGEPSIAVEPKTLEFGDVLVGQDKSLTLNIINTSSQIVRVTGTIEGEDADEFGIVGSSVIDIGVGEIGNLNIKFTPKSAGQKSATLRLSYIGLGLQEYVLVPLTGTGIAEGGGGDGGGGGCFIATAAFGSPLHRCVGILRTYRDSVLLKNKAGKAFVEWYYIHSPAVARMIEKSPGLRIFVRIFLIPVICIVWLIINGLLPYIIFGAAISGILIARKK